MNSLPRTTALLALPALLALVSPLAAQNEDPRVELVRLQAADRLEEALDALAGLAALDSPPLSPESIDYLRGHLLSRLRRDQAAAQSFARVVDTGSPLSEYARLRIADLQADLGFAPAAAALATQVLAASPPREIVGRVLTLLDRTLEQGGDCQVLDRVGSVRLRTTDRRRLDLIRARCALRAGRAEGRSLLLGLLREEYRDLEAFLAADLLHPLLPTIDSAEGRRLLAKTYHYHRRFDRALPLHVELVEADPGPIRSESDFDQTFQMVRAHYWLGQYHQAARGYRDLAELSTLSRNRARALFHRGRSLELADQWREARRSYLEAYRTQTDGSVAASSLLAALRLYSRSGQEADAGNLYQALGTSASFRNERVLASLFLAASRLSQSRVEGARQWLDDAGARDETVLTHYWSGRLAELEGEPRSAIDHYLDALREDYYHPVAQVGLQRLDRNDLRTHALAMGRRIADSGSDPLATWILLGAQSTEGQQARIALAKRYAARGRGGEIAPVTSVSPEAWPLWDRAPAGADELLLTMGIWSEAGDAVNEHFPVSQPHLAFTAALELERAGRVRDSLLIVENLEKRVPRGTPAPLVPEVFRRSLYPFAYRFLIEQAARRFQVDPLLMAAIIREESRFEPRASSAAAARGLTQFIIPTAERFAEQVGLDGLTPQDLEKPEIAVTLGAAYLRELSSRFDGRPEQILAAYNAGEDQAEAWSDYCYSTDPAEYITKISFRETREYVVKVMRSYAQYRELYPESAL